MSSSKLLELAERCEQAAGPDRELDGEIAYLAAGYGRYDDEPTALYKDGERYTLNEPDYYELSGKVREIPAFTASLDAAMTLVPEECEHIRKEWHSGTAWVVVVGYDGHQGRGATPALALCAASLRALDQHTGSVG